MELSNLTPAKMPYYGEKGYAEVLTPWQIKNISLANCENAIKKHLCNIQERYLDIAFELIQIAQRELYTVCYYARDSYCKNIYQYGNKELGLSKTTISNLINIVKAFCLQTKDNYIPEF